MLNSYFARTTLMVMMVVIVSILPVISFFELAEAGVIHHAAFDHDDSDEFSIYGLTASLVGLLLISAVIGLVVGMVAARQIVKPINELVEGVKRLGQGELGYQVGLKCTNREMGILVDAVNSMSADLKGAERLRQNLMADVSHELRTPLTILEGNLRAALDDVYGLDKQEIANLYGQTQHLIRLVNDLHLLTTVEAHQLPLDCQETDVSIVATEVHENFKLVAEEKGIQFSLRCDRELEYRPISLDPARLRQVLTNLVDNAIRHTDSGGKVVIATHNNDQDVTIRISDSGTGIAPEHLPRVFERFYRTDPSRTRGSGGSGLGLAIVQALVDVQGGTVSVESDGINCGTSFLLRFPY